MLRNLLSKGGCVATRIFSNPCPKFRVITRGDSTSHEAVEEQMIHEQTPQEEDLKFLLILINKKTRSMSHG
jgi:hypothetical protein